MKLSMMSYTMSRQPQHFDLKKMFELTVELQLDGIDLVTLHNTDAKTLRQMADDHGVPVVCHTFQADLNAPDAAGRKAGMDAVKRGLEAAKVLGAPVVMIPTPGKKERARDESRRNWIQGLREAARFAHAVGVVLTVENFPGPLSPFVIADDLLEAIASVPSLRVTFDAGNAGTGEPPAESFRRTAKYVVHAHFKDWYIKSEATEEPGFRQMLDGRWYKSALIGEGDIDHKSVIAAMKEARYAGCINIEYEGNDYTPADGVRKAVEYLRSIGA